jgi:two-component system, OmpR family, phosphate regulon sensor histidine kinase PhoR
MLWPVLTVLAIAGLVTLHLWWRNKCRRLEQTQRRDIEELNQHQKQAALQVQAQQDALFDSMAEGLVLLDEAGRIQLANRAFTKLFGLGADIRSRTIIEALRLHELAGLVSSLTAEAPELEHELKLSAPNERWLQVSAAAIFNQRGGRQGTILVFHDLTRLKQLESARKEFVANVSHELRTPLSLIKGYVETLLDGARDNPEVAVKFLQTIDRNAERLKLLIEDLLTISELESGRVKLNLQPVALVPLVEKVFADLRARAVARSVSLLNQIPDMTVRGDPDRLEQVLGNLIDNAIKYGRAEGTVTAGGKVLEDGQVELFVQDDGPGIPVEALDRVFERFYRVDKARSREQGGTGLGLSIVKHIVQSHGGKVWAKSEPGHGSQFCFTLPPDSGDLQQALL